MKQTAGAVGLFDDHDFEEDEQSRLDEIERYFGIDSGIGLQNMAIWAAGEIDDAFNKSEPPTWNHLQHVPDIFLKVRRIL